MPVGLLQHGDACLAPWLQLSSSGSLERLPRDGEEGVSRWPVAALCGQPPGCESQWQVCSAASCWFS